MPSIRVIKKPTAQNIVQGKGEVIYYVSQNETKKTFHIRITESTGGGFLLQ